MGIILLLAVLSATPSVGEKNPIYAAPTKPTQKQIRDLLAGGAILVHSGDDCGTQYVIGSDGRLDYLAGGIPYMQCQSERPFRLSGNALEFDCKAQLKGGDGSLFEEKRITISLELLMLAPGVLVFRASDNWRDSGPGRSDPPFWAYSAPVPSRDGCSGNTWPIALAFEDGYVAPPRVELIPGAKDRALFEKVRDHARSASDGWQSFEGPPAKVPRVESEVFYVGDQQDQANGVAKALEPVIGKVQVKPWPGEWDYPVVVVVGSKVAGGAAPSAPSKDSPAAR